MEKVAKTQMLIRKPITEVFNAFIDPEITSKFWFTLGSGKLEKGKKLIWRWEMYQLNVPLIVKDIVENEKILIEWGEGDMISKVEWKFQELSKNRTFVEIINSDFKGMEEEKISKVMDSVEGFTLVLAGVKAWLEHGVQLNLIEDKFPKELM